MEGKNRKRVKTNVNASYDWADTFRTLFSLVDSDSGSGSITDLETNLEGSGCGSAKISNSLETASSSWSNSSSDVFLQVNPQVLPKSQAPNDVPKPNDGTDPLYTNNKIDVASQAWRMLEGPINDRQESIPQSSDVTHESFMPCVLPTQSPPNQVMERTGSSDPNRVPTSIFSTPSTLTEWSIASDESLFSIRIDNYSFSKNHELKISGDMHRSEELTQSGEIFKSGELYLSRELYRSGKLYQSGELYKYDDLKRSGELSRFKATSSDAKGVEPNENGDMSKNLSEDMRPGAKAVVDKPISDVPEAWINTGSGTNLGESSDLSSTNHQSDGSEISIQSFASLTKKKPACRLCHCLYCCWVYCCYKWPSCCFKWPNCCCKWPSCCCKWPSCHFKCPTWSSCCCNCHGSSCRWACCYCWNRKPKKRSSFYTLMDEG